MRHSRPIVAALAVFVLSACAGQTPAASPGSTSTGAAATSIGPRSEPSSSSHAVTSSSEATREPTSSSVSESTAESVFATRPTLSCSNQTALDRSMDVNFVGQSSPVEAAKWFVVQPSVEGFAVSPDAVWTVSGQSETASSSARRVSFWRHFSRPSTRRGVSRAPRGVCRRSNASFAGSKSWQGGTPIDQSTDRHVLYCGSEAGCDSGLFA